MSKENNKDQEPESTNVISDISDRFSLTFLGYKEACEYLHSIDKLDEALTKGQSVDGFSIIHKANILYAKN